MGLSRRPGQPVIPPRRVFCRGTNTALCRASELTQVNAAALPALGALHLLVGQELAAGGIVTIVGAHQS